MMKNWLSSLNGAITFSVFAFLAFLGRAFMDWRYEYPVQDPRGTWNVPGVLFYLLLAGLWLWGLLAAAHGNRRGLIGCLAAVLLLDVAFALLTFFVFCPPWSGCLAWPTAWLWTWVNLISGVVAVFALTVQLRQGKAAR